MKKPLPLIENIFGVIGLAGTRKGGLALHIPNRGTMTIISSFLRLDVDEIYEDFETAERIIIPFRCDAGEFAIDWQLEK